MSADLPMSISQKALLLCTQTWEWFVIRHSSLGSLFRFRSERLRRLHRYHWVSREKVPRVKDSFVLCGLRTILSKPLFCARSSTMRRSSLALAPPRYPARARMRVRACVRTLETASVSTPSSKTDSWQSSLRTLLLLVLPVKVQRRSPSCTYFFLRAAFTSSEGVFSPAFVRIPNHSIRPSPWRDDGHQKDRLCLCGSNPCEDCLIVND